MADTDNLHEPYCKLINEPLTQGDVLEGLAQLATTGIVEVTDMVEALHQEIVLRPLGRFNPQFVSGWQKSMTGQIYQFVRTMAQQNGKWVATGLREVNQRLGDKGRRRLLPSSEKILVNAMNGLLGDHLIHQQNPLALSMVLYDRYGKPLRQSVSGRVVILVHGLCMSFLSWRPRQVDSLEYDIAKQMPDAVVLYLDYNTGRRISQNGQNFSRVLQTLLNQNPKITQIDLIGHSMGGLVCRSALFYAQQNHHLWQTKVKHLVCLGSPHHGAMLEKLGYFLQDLVAKLPFASTFSHLLDFRSAGIIDLRHGNVRDEDWENLGERVGVFEDCRHPTPLPEHIHTYLVAGCLEKQPSYKLAPNLLGDGLVKVTSALGEHDEDHHLNVPECQKAIFYGVNHMALQYDKAVRQQIIEWLMDKELPLSYVPIIHRYQADEIEMMG